ncbi:MAG: gamma-glutamylcyclotransferase [Gemmatimonadota bacterium]
MARLLAYGSLMWDNALATYEGDAVRVGGFQRAFVGQSTDRWGNSEHPCPQIGLVEGGECGAVLFRLPSAGRRYLLHNLRQRERRDLKSIKVQDPAGRRRRAKVFLPSSSETVWGDISEVVEALRRARGLAGTGSEYVRTMIHAMELWGIEDPLISRVWEAVRD